MFADLISVSSFDLHMKVDFVFVFFVFLVGKTTNRRQRCSITNCIIQLSQGGDIGKASSQHLLLWSRWCLNLPPLNTSRLQSLLGGPMVTGTIDTAAPFCGFSGSNQFAKAAQLQSDYKKTKTKLGGYRRLIGNL